jgi:hypothetical protein
LALELCGIKQFCLEGHVLWVIFRREVIVWGWNCWEKDQDLSRRILAVKARPREASDKKPPVS